jgi:dTDP-4-amino-4,6-dideoxygalactose transaminase
LPKTPVLDWPSFASRPPIARTASLDGITHRVVTTSGRAALLLALADLRVAAGRRVLVPTYHCPSMVAPVVQAGAVPQFFAIGPDGLPDLDRIAIDPADAPVAMIAAHYFGLPRSLRKVRAWCDAHSIVLIEDCAHCFFGQAGERTVGHWGDYAVASLTKFFPVPEAGLLLRAHVPLDDVPLRSPRWRDEIKGVVDVLELACAHGRLRGISGPLRALFALKNRHRRPSNVDHRPATGSHPDEATPPSAVTDCDMSRAGVAPLKVSRVLFRLHGRHRMHARRRENYRAYAASLGDVPGVWPLEPNLSEGTAPYVFPLLVDDAERVYHALRREGMPVFRWDRVWPGTPRLPGDRAPHWQRHLLQLVCHQNLSLADIDAVGAAVKRWGAAGNVARAASTPV